jgi:tetratricopeptide (TPR) repeat protein
MTMAEITAGLLAAAARSLMRAGQFTQAAELLDATAAADAGERAVLDVAAAEVGVDRDFWCRTASAEAVLARAAESVASAAGDRTLGWDLDMQRLRHDYFAELFTPDGTRSGPDGRDPAVIGDLAARARRLRELAPDGGRAAAATFYAGVVEDNLREDHTAAEALFAEALAAAEDAGADLTVSEALRHLGYWTGQHGDTALAREQWERATRLRQRAGAIPYVLAQYLVLAELDRDEGDVARARTLAGEVRHWALALGLPFLASQAAELADEPAKDQA